jgi:hypothetical protein
LVEVATPGLVTRTRGRRDRGRAKAVGLIRDHDKDDRKEPTVTGRR